MHKGLSRRDTERFSISSHGVQELSGTSLRKIKFHFSVLLAINDLSSNNILLNYLSFRDVNRQCVLF